MKHLNLGIAAAALGLLLGGCTTGPETVSYASPTDEDFEFIRGTDREPTPETLYFTARALAAQRKEDQARYTLLRLIRDHPGFVPAYNDLAEHYMRQRQLDDAHEALTQGLAIAPDDAMLINNLGMVWMLRGEHDRALEQFARASELEPDDARYRANIAAAHGLAGRYDEALSTYVQIMPPAQAHYNVAVLARARDDKAAAEREFQEAYRLDPTLRGGSPPEGPYQP